jgi:hypothetical protein
MEESISEGKLCRLQYLSSLNFVERQKIKNLSEDVLNEDVEDEIMKENNFKENNNEDNNKKQENNIEEQENNIEEQENNIEEQENNNIEEKFFSNNNYETDEENTNKENENIEEEEEIEIKIKKSFLIQIIFYLFNKLNISKTAFISLIVVFNFLFKTKFNYSFFENKIKKKIKIENKKIDIFSGEYIYNKIQTQIENLLNYENNFEEIKKNIKKIKEKNNNNNGVLSDITDGKNYQKKFSDIETNLEEIDLNMILNIDGISPYNISPQNYYCVCGQIIELQLKYRLNYINQIIIFLIKSKIFIINEIFKQFVEDLNKLYLIGFIYKNKYLVRLRIIAYSCDLPARALLFNQNQFNGFFSCIFCKTKGEFVKGAGVRFPNSELDCDGEEKLINCDERLINDFNTTTGFKSNTNWYNHLVYFEPCHVAIDVLHQCFEGKIF